MNQTPPPSFSDAAITRLIVGAVLAVALLLPMGIAGGGFASTGRVDVAAPFVCPAGYVTARVATTVERDSEGVGTNYYLDCIDAAGRPARVPTLTLIVALYAIVAVPCVVLAVAGLAAWGLARRRRRS